MMPQITLQALIKTLANNKFSYVIEKSPWDKSGNTLMFVAANGYPVNSPYVVSEENCDTIIAEKNRHTATVLLHYSTKMQRVIAACPIFNEMIKKLTSEQKTNTKPELSDD